MPLFFQQAPEQRERGADFHAGLGGSSAFDIQVKRAGTWYLFGSAGFMWQRPGGFPKEKGTGAACTGCKRLKKAPKLSGATRQGGW